VAVAPNAGGTTSDVPPVLVGAAATFSGSGANATAITSKKIAVTLVAPGPEGVRSECGRDYIQNVPSIFVGAAAIPSPPAQADE